MRNPITYVKKAKGSGTPLLLLFAWPYVKLPYLLASIGITIGCGVTLVVTGLYEDKKRVAHEAQVKIEVEEWTADMKRRVR